MNETTVDGVAMSTDILRLQAETKITYKLGMNFHTYYFPCVALIGLIGNGLSLCILLKPRNRKFPCYRTLTALSISDMIILLGGYYNWIILLLDAMNETHCKIWTYLFQTAALSSALMAGFVTVHKYLAFLSPFKSHNWRSPQRTLKIIFFIVVLSISYNIVHIYADNTIDLDGKVCIGITNYTPYSRALSSVALTLNTILPVIAVFVMNTLIIKALNKSKKFCQSSVMSNSKQTNNQPNASKMQAENQLKNGNPGTKGKDPLRHYDKPTANYHKNSAVLLIAVTIAFSFLTPPLFCYYIAYNFIDYTKSADAYAIYVMLYYVFL